LKRGPFTTTTCFCKCHVLPQWDRLKWTFWLSLEKRTYWGRCGSGPYGALCTHAEIISTIGHNWHWSVFIKPPLACEPSPRLEYSFSGLSRTFLCSPSSAAYLHVFLGYQAPGSKVLVTNKLWLQKTRCVDTPKIG
jgi:hypothetical protein